MADVLLFGGTDVTLAVAEAVLAAGAKLAGIVTVGESFSISYSARPIANTRFADIPKWCAVHGVPAIKFETYDRALTQIGDRPIPVCLVAGWYHMVPRAVRERFARGAIGFHASLLPQLRGGAPLNWAILSGLRETGLTMFRLTDGVDDGPIYGQKRFPIGPRTAVGDLVRASGEASAALVRELLPGVLDGSLEPVPQSGTASYAMQRQPEDGRIDWTRSADAIDRLVRAASRPYPGAFTYFEGRKILLWRTEPIVDAPAILAVAGQLVRLPDIDYPGVVTGDGLLTIVEATDESGATVVDLLRKSSQKRFTTGA